MVVYVVWGLPFCLSLTAPLVPSLRLHTVLHRQFSSLFYIFLPSLFSLILLQDNHVNGEIQAWRKGSLANPRFWREHASSVATGRLDATTSGPAVHRVLLKGENAFMRWHRLRKGLSLIRFLSFFFLCPLLAFALEFFYKFTRLSSGMWR